jgi:LPXTG-motif cell wall-anchored protein
MNTLCDLLTKLDPTTVNTTGSTIITENNFATNASILLTSSDESTGLYKTDVSFTLEMIPTDNDDLVVTVTDSTGRTVAVRRLSGAGAETKADSQVTDTGMIYTLKNLEIAEGVTITLNLSGTQVLNQGVYLYTANVFSDSQTFIGISAGKQQVSLSVDLSFETAHTADSKTTTQTDRYLDVSYSYSDKTDITTETSTTTTERTNTNTKVYANVTVTDVTETNTGRDWTFERIDSISDTSTPNDPTPTPTPTPTPNPTPTPTPNPDPSDNDTTIPDEDPPLAELPDDDMSMTELPNEDPPLAELPDEDTPLTELPDEDVPLTDLPDEDVPLEDLPDEDVPLADIPQTGDNSLLWVTIVILSGLCLVYLVFSSRKREEA